MRLLFGEPFSAVIWAISIAAIIVSIRRARKRAEWEYKANGGDDPMYGKVVLIKATGALGRITRVDRSDDGKNPLCIRLAKGTGLTTWETDTDVEVLS